MQSLQQDNKNSQEAPNKNTSPHLSTISTKDPFGKSSLSPFSLTTLETSKNISCASYCQSHNMLSVSFFDSTMTFYNATTLLPLEGRETRRLKGFVMSMSYHEETDIFIIGCEKGFIYSYNVGKDELKKLQKCQFSVREITFLNSKLYAFGVDGPKNAFSIGSLDDEKKIYNVSPEYSNCVTLERFLKRNLLFSGFENGCVRIYRTDNLPYMRVFCSRRVCQAGGFGVGSEIININGKEYIVTSDDDRTLKIWHLIKGRMRLLRVIHLGGTAYRFDYLENYKMIATLCDGSNEIKFWNFVSGKLEKTFTSSKSQGVNDLFLMKNRNVIGAIGGAGGLENRYDMIEFIQLHPCDEN